MINYLDEIVAFKFSAVIVGFNRLFESIFACLLDPICCYEGQLELPGQ